MALVTLPLFVLPPFLSATIVVDDVSLEVRSVTVVNTGTTPAPMHLEFDDKTIDEISIPVGSTIRNLPRRRYTCARTDEDTIALTGRIAVESR